MPASALLEQLHKAGVSKQTANDTLTEHDKTKLFEYLRKSHGEIEPKAKITLRRKQTAEINAADTSEPVHEIMSQKNPIPQPVAKCHSCEKPLYGRVKYCPFCGEEARDVIAMATGEEAVAAPVAAEKSSSVEMPAVARVHVVDYTPTEVRVEPPVLADATLPEAPERLLKPKVEKKEAGDLAQEPNPETKLDTGRSRWFPKLIIVSVIAGIGWWYLKKSPESAPIPTSPSVNVSKQAPSKRPKASVSAPQMPAPTMPSSKQKSVESSSGVALPSVKESKPYATELSVTAVGEILSLFPLNETRKLLGAMLDGARDGNDAGIILARRSLQGISVPPRGDRKAARAANTTGLDALQKGDANEAVKWLLGAVKADPADQEIVNNLAFALYKSQRLVDARSAALAALTLAPERGAAWANLATILADEGKADSAVAGFLLLHRFSTNQQKTKEYLQKLIQEDASVQVREAAETALSKILKGEVVNSAVGVLLAGMLHDGLDCMMKKKYDCAITNAKSALRIDPTNEKAKELQNRAEAEQQRAMNSILIQ